MNILIIGHTGFIGRAVEKVLSKKHSVSNISLTEVDRNVFNMEFDIAVNCAGYAWKYQVNQFPYNAFIIEIDILRLLSELKFRKIIHISSIDALGQSNYGQVKRFVEEQIKRKYDNVIIRPAGLVGEGLKKNVVFDILNNNIVYDNPDSIYNFITTTKLGQIIEMILDKGIKVSPINIEASQNITVCEIAKLLGKSPRYYKEADVKRNYISIDIFSSLFSMKTSEEYIMEFLESYDE